ncbi:hypothetical protein T552_03240 [Pneumocystis carinii B80]|uniref:G-patch domain-containing protein n=1 Tax=Pneumocystis carinii (strain B80) TaxID=1408658 RepID=A0A0W4ZCD2_PNEC8|nr:hypothetical protein T552_03240 [Pneumocystis carinii B80]KTW25966.1 hypothetical protein T552_03240 [Pneumocystis carinii B80]
MGSYSSSSDENSDENMEDLDREDQEEFGLFLKHRKRSYKRDTKEDRMLGVFAGDSDEEYSGIGEKQLRYKHVRFTTPKQIDEINQKNRGYLDKKSIDESEKDSSNRHGRFSYVYKPRTDALNEKEAFYSPKQDKKAEMKDESDYPRSFKSPIESELKNKPKSVNSETSKYFKNSGFGAKMLEKMGYIAGQGLGSQGQGILNPVETKVRPTRAGLGLIKEKTQQAIDESRRRGEISEDEEDQHIKKPIPEKKSERIHKEKIKHKTASEIAGGMEVPPVLQQIIDMTEKEVKLIENVSGTMSIPMTLSRNDEMYQISLLARRDLEMYATEWKQLQDRKVYIEMEELRINEDAEKESIKIEKLEKIIKEIEDIYLFCKNNSEDSLVLLNNISGILEEIQHKFLEEIEIYNLDEVIISILFPIIKPLFLSWDPLEEPSPVLNFFHKWKQIIGVKNVSEIDQDDHFSLKQTIMTPFESMLQHLWVPKVRSAINNTWNPYNYSSALFLFESWKNLLSPFIQDFVLNQLIFPKLQKSIFNWNPRNFIKKKDSRLPHIWLFPWLPLLKENTETLIDSVKRKFKMILSSWDIKDGPIEELNVWKEIFGDTQFEKLMLTHILPKLSACLRLDFFVDPSDQKLEPLEWILPWRSFFKPSVFDQLFATEFFPKWMDILYIWLTDSECNYTQVSEWYQWWQQVFPPEMLEMPMIRESFINGLDMMHQALNLGNDVSEKLLPPVTNLTQPIEIETKETPLPKTYSKQLEDRDVEFKDVVEEFCLEHDLVLIPLRKAHEGTGNPLFRITASASGTGGIIVYIKGDVVWVQNIKNKNEFNPESLNYILTLVQRSGSQI